MFANLERGNAGWPALLGLGLLIVGWLVAAGVLLRAWAAGALGS